MADDINKGALTDQRALYDQIMTWFLAELDRDQPWRALAKESFKFYMGGKHQWDPNDLKKAREDERPALTINRIKKQCKSVVGFFVQNKQDIRPLPTDSSEHDAALATLMFQLVKHETSPQRSAFQWQLKQAIKEGVICGRGWLMPFINFDNDPVNGQPDMEWVRWNEVVKDSSSMFYDLRDATFAIRFQMLPAWKAKSLWPDFKEDIDTAFTDQLPMSILPPGQLKEGDPTDGYLTADRENLFRNKATKDILVLDAWYRVPKMGIFAIVKETGQNIEWPGTRAKFEEQFQGQLDKFDVQERQTVQVREAVVVPATQKVFVDDSTPFTIPPLNKKLPIIPYFYDSTDDGEGHQTEFGIVEDLKDPQRETNKRRSQFTEIVGVTATGGFFAEEGFSDDNLDQVQARTRKPGWWIFHKRNKKPEQVPPPSFPAAFVQLDAMSMQDFFSIGLDPSTIGLSQSGDESGRALLIKNAGGTLQLQEPFDNYAWTVTMAGQWYVGMIQQTYNERRVLNVMGDDGERLKLVINGEDGSQVQQADGLPLPPDDDGQDLSAIIKDFRTSQFDIVVDTSPFAPTTQIATMSLLQELSQTHPVPADLIFRFAPIPNRDLLVKSLKGMVPQKPMDQAANAEIGRNTPQTNAQGQVIVPGAQNGG